MNDVIIRTDFPDLGHLGNEDRPDTIQAWASLYLTSQVAAGSVATRKAKISDLRRFVDWYVRATGSDHIDAWSRSVTEAYQHELLNRTPRDRPLKASTINRYMATVKVFGSWLHRARPLLAGNPVEKVKDLAVDLPAWMGLTDRSVLRLKSSCEQLIAISTKSNQYPIRDAAVFWLLLYTGLRAGELCSLGIDQWEETYLSRVRRKGKRIIEQVPVPREARAWVSRYIDEDRPRLTDRPLFGKLFLGRNGNPLTTAFVCRIFIRIERQANSRVPESERIRLRPHMLRHTFLRRITEKHGIHVAHRMSGNVTIRNIFRYVMPSPKEVAKYAENLFE